MRLRIITALFALGIMYPVARAQFALKTNLLYWATTTPKLGAELAVSVNSLKSLTLIPIGVFADDYELYTLSFAGISMLESPVLIDNYEDTETPISEDFNLDMEGPSHGRYYIHTQEASTTGIEDSAI